MSAESVWILAYVFFVLVLACVVCFLLSKRGKEEKKSWRRYLTNRGDQ